MGKGWGEGPRSRGFSVTCLCEGAATVSVIMEGLGARVGVPVFFPPNFDIVLGPRTQGCSPCRAGERQDTSVDKAASFSFTGVTQSKNKRY